MASTNTSISTDSVMGKVGKMTSNKSNVIIGLAGTLFISMFITAFVQMSNFIGSKDDWNALKSQITKVIVIVMIGTIAFIVASLMFFVQDPNKSIYFTIIVSGLSLGLAFASMSIAAISR
jgi:hypothetical protein